MPIVPRIYAGRRGPTGPQGPTTEWRSAGGYLQSRPTGGTWTNVSAWSDIVTSPSAFTFKGAVASAANLPASGELNDLWVADDTDRAHVWDGSQWVDVGSIRGPEGPAGSDGADGTNGTDGADGVGVPAGGTAGQTLAKASGTDYDTGWSDPVTGIPDGGATGQALVKASPSDGDVAWGDGAEGAAKSWADVTSFADYPGGGYVLADPATAGDGLVRNIGAGKALDLQDGGISRFAIDRATGQFIVRDLPMRVALHWYAGEGDPTANGFDGSLHHLVLHLGPDDTVPAWAEALDGPVTVEQETGGTGSTQTYTLTWDGKGLTDESTITVGTAGTGDTPITAIHAGSPTVEGTGVPAAFPSGAQMVEFDPTAGQCAFYWTLSSSTTRRIRGFLRTPATLATLVLAGFKDSGDECARLILGSNGAVRVSASNYVVAMASTSGVVAAASDYYYEMEIEQDATAANSIVRVWVYDSTGAQSFASGDIIDSNSVGFGTTHNQVWVGHFGSGTGGVFYGGRYRALDSTGTAIPLSA